AFSAKKTSRPRVGDVPWNGRTVATISRVRGDDRQRSARRWRRAGSGRASSQLAFERVLERTNDADIDNLAHERRSPVVGDVHDLVSLGAARHPSAAGLALAFDQNLLRRPDE